MSCSTKDTSRRDLFIMTLLSKSSSRKCTQITQLRPASASVFTFFFYIIYLVHKADKFEKAFTVIGDNHFRYHLSTSSCQLSLWTPPDIEKANHKVAHDIWAYFKHACFCNFFQFRNDLTLLKINFSKMNDTYSQHQQPLCSRKPILI